MRKPIKYILKLAKITVVVVLFYWVSFQVRFVPLRYYFSKYFTHGNENDNISHSDQFHRNIILIKNVLKKLPGKKSCLKESIVVYLFFRLYGIHIPLYLGLKTQDEFRAHAWYNDSRSLGFTKLLVLQDDEKR